MLVVRVYVLKYFGDGYDTDWCFVLVKPSHKEAANAFPLFPSLLNCVLTFVLPVRAWAGWGDRCSKVKVGVPLGDDKGEGRGVVNKYIVSIEDTHHVYES